MNEFQEKVGFEYLKAVHLNDSKGSFLPLKIRYVTVYVSVLGPCNSKLDRHEHIGQGKIGKIGFQLLMNDPRFDGIPMILETPEGQYPEEMILLHSMENV